MQRLLRRFVLTLSCTIAVAPLMADETKFQTNATAVLASNGDFGPNAGYYLWDYFMEYEEDETPYGTATASVTTTAVYRLEDGTHIGTEVVTWDGRGSEATESGSLGQNVSMFIGGTVGTWAGWSFGGTVAGWVAGNVAVGASTSTYALGLGALATGPYIGALAVGALGVV